MNAELEFAKLIAPLVASWLTPSLASIVKKYGDIKLEHLPFLSSGFEAYLKRSYDKYQYLNTVVFPNQKLKLDDLYEPLHINRQTSGTEVESVLVSRFPRKQFDHYKNILLVDTAGMGKSTIAKFVYLSAIRENIGIPLLIELRRLTRDRPILSFIKDELSELEGYISTEAILKLIHQGGFLFILDGYDEIAHEDRAAVTADIQDFKERAKSNLYLMTSRDEPGLSAFPDFMRFTIAPMPLDAAFSLISRYSNAALDPETGDKLISKLKSPESATVSEFLINPLLVSLLFKAFDYKRIVPLKRVLFYRQVFDALFELHDLSKKGGELIREKKSRLSIDDFDRVLRHLAFIHIRSQKVEYSKDEILKSIDQARNRCPGLVFWSSDFLSDLILAVPIFVRDGVYFRWAHKSIQEYFAAQFICRDTKGEQQNILNKLATGSEMQRYLNLLSLCYEIDYKSFLQSVVHTLLTSILEREKYQREYPGVPKEAVDARRLRSGVYEFVIAHLDPTELEFPPKNPLGPGIHAKAIDKLNAHLGDRVQLLDGSSKYRLSQFAAVTFQTCEAALLSHFVGKPGFEFVHFHSPTVPDTSIEVDLGQLLGAGDCQVLTDDPDSSFNQQALFETVTNLISEQAELWIDFQRCHAEMREIAASVEDAKTDLLEFGSSSL